MALFRMMPDCTRMALGCSDVHLHTRLDAGRPLEASAMYRCDLYAMLSIPSRIRPVLARVTVPSLKRTYVSVAPIGDVSCVSQRIADLQHHETHKRAFLARAPSVDM